MTNITKRTTRIETSPSSIATQRARDGRLRDGLPRGPGLVRVFVDRAAALVEARLGLLLEDQGLLERLEHDGDGARLLAARRQDL